MKSELLSIANNDHKHKVIIDFEQLSDETDIPELIKMHDTVLRFPEKLMLLILYVERTYTKGCNKQKDACISWTQDGTALIIRNQDELVNRVFPRVFRCKGRFNSFTRKLYRWGFRQQRASTSQTRTGVIKDIKVFFHQYFQRDNKKLTANMRSTTAEQVRRTMPATSGLASLLPPQDDQLPRLTKADLPSPLVLQQQDMPRNHLAQSGLLSFNSLSLPTSVFDHRPLVESLLFLPTPREQVVMAARRSSLLFPSSTNAMGSDILQCALAMRRARNHTGELARIVSQLLVTEIAEQESRLPASLW